MTRTIQIFYGAHLPLKKKFPPGNFSSAEVEYSSLNPRQAFKKKKTSVNVGRTAVKVYVFYEDIGLTPKCSFDKSKSALWLSCHLMYCMYSFHDPIVSTALHNGLFVTKLNDGLRFFLEADCVLHHILNLG